MTTAPSSCTHGTTLASKRAKVCLDCGHFWDKADDGTWQPRGIDTGSRTVAAVGRIALDIKGEG